MKRINKIILLGLLFLMVNVANAQNDTAAAPEYNVLLKVVNNLGEGGYFSVCDKPINPKSESLCSIPQSIHAGTTGVYIPYYRDTYVVFTKMDESYLVCARAEAPGVQAKFNINPNAANQITLMSYLKNSDGSTAAVTCQ